MELGSPASQADSLPTKLSGKPRVTQKSRAHLALVWHSWLQHIGMVSERQANTYKRREEINYQVKPLLGGSESLSRCATSTVSSQKRWLSSCWADNLEKSCKYWKWPHFISKKPAPLTHLPNPQLTAALKETVSDPADLAWLIKQHPGGGIRMPKGR